MGGDARQVAGGSRRLVGEGPGVDLVDDGRLPPRCGHGADCRGPLRALSGVDVIGNGSGRPEWHAAGDLDRSDRRYTFAPNATYVGAGP